MSKMLRHLWVGPRRPVRTLELGLIKQSGAIQQPASSQPDPANPELDRSEMSEKTPSILLCLAGQAVVNEYSRLHNLNMFDGVELRSTTRQSG